MADCKLYEDIALRTDGDIYLGVVGPVRTGKSTFIKRFMETLVIPNIDNIYVKERAIDELPQSGSGRTIMTAEPKFIPEDAVNIELNGDTVLSVRLIDCVGFMVSGAAGQFENGEERMVATPWFDHEVSMTQAAEEGTRKVISEHSTIGLVITTDGTICGIDRDEYVEAEERVVNELKEIGKPFAVVINSTNPESEAAQSLRTELTEKYGVGCICLSCLELDEKGIAEVIRSVLMEFPVSAVGVSLPSWVDALPYDHTLRAELFKGIFESADGMVKLRDVENFVRKLGTLENIGSAEIRSISMGTGEVFINVSLRQSLYYSTLSAQSGFEISDDGDLMALLTELSSIKVAYDRISGALKDVHEKGYGAVLPSMDDMELDSPEIVSRGGKYSVRLKARAESIYMVKVNIETEVSPAIGGEKASEEVVSFLLQGFDGDVNRIWESNIFGKSLYDIAAEGLAAKIQRMPEDVHIKLRDTLGRIINEGSGGLICIIL